MLRKLELCYLITFLLVRRQFLINATPSAYYISSNQTWSKTFMSVSAYKSCFLGGSLVFRIWAAFLFFTFSWCLWFENLQKICFSSDSLHLIIDIIPGMDAPWANISVLWFLLQLFDFEFLTKKINFFLSKSDVILLWVISNNIRGSTINVW